MLTAYQIDGLMQERCNSIANALEKCRSCNNPSKLSYIYLPSTVMYTEMYHMLLRVNVGNPLISPAASSTN